MYPYFGFKMRKISFQSIGSIWNTERMKVIIPNKEIRQVSFERKECRSSLFMSIVPLFFSTLQISIWCLLSKKITICFLISPQIVFKGFSICSCKEFPKKPQIFIRWYLWFLSDISSDYGYLMKLTHLSRNLCSIFLCESSKESSLPI